MRFPEQNFAIALLCNVDTANTTKLTRAIADLYLASEFKRSADVPADPPAPTRKPVPELPPEFNLSDYEGHYFSEEVGGHQHIGPGGPNSLRFSGFDGVDLIPTDVDVFHNLRRNFDLVFSRNAEGKVTGFTYNGQRAAGLYFQLTDEGPASQCNR